MNPQYYGPESSAPNGNGMLKIVLLVIGVLMTIFIVIAVLLSGAGIGDDLKSATLSSNEIVRITTKASANPAANNKVKNHAITAEVVLRSHINSYRAFGDALTDKELAGLGSIENDSTLLTAENDGKFNEVYTELMSSLLVNTSSTLQLLIDGDTKINEKALLALMLEDLQVLYDDLNV